MQLINYLQKAADQEQIDALVKIGLFYLTGFIVGANSHQAALYFKKAADKGSVIGQFNYGLSLLKGEGLNKKSSLPGAFFVMQFLLWV